VTQLSPSTQARSVGQEEGGPAERRPFTRRSRRLGGDADPVVACWRQDRRRTTCAAKSSPLVADGRLSRPAQHVRCGRCDFARQRDGHPRTQLPSSRLWKVPLGNPNSRRRRTPGPSIGPDDLAGPCRVPRTSDGCEQVRRAWYGSSVGQSRVIRIFIADLPFRGCAPGSRRDVRSCVCRRA